MWVPSYEDHALLPVSVYLLFLDKHLLKLSLKELKKGEKKTRKRDPTPRDLIWMSSSDI